MPPLELSKCGMGSNISVKFGEFLPMGSMISSEEEEEEEEEERKKERILPITIIIILNGVCFHASINFSCSLSPSAKNCPYNDKTSRCPHLKKRWGCTDVDVAIRCPASCKCNP